MKIWKHRAVAIFATILLVAVLYVVLTYEVTLRELDDLHTHSSFSRGGQRTSLLPIKSSSQTGVVKPHNFAERCQTDWNSEAAHYQFNQSHVNCCGGGRSFRLRSERKATPTNETEFHYEYYWGAPLGNALVHYFNGRGVAFLKNEIFKANPFRTNNAGENMTLEGILACFPLEAHPLDFAETPSERERMVKALGFAQKEGALRSIFDLHGYPHAVQGSAWRLIRKTIAREVQAIGRAWASLPAHMEDSPGILTAVMYTRCDDYIINLHDDYGILPHRFFLDRLPAETEHVVIVRKKEDKENGCLWSLNDLVDTLTTSRPDILTVTFRSSPEAISDWLYLARAPVLFCAPSTFCLTAAWANPNNVFFAVNGQRTAVVADDPAFIQYGVLFPDRWDDLDFSDESGELTMVETDFLPGKTIKNMSKDAVLDYARSTSCIPAVYRCMP